MDQFADLAALIASTDVDQRRVYAGLMIISVLKGKGRRARLNRDGNDGGWLFRAFMAWFARNTAGRM